MFTRAMFPNDDPELRVAFLKPNNTSPAVLARWRLTCFCWMVTQILLRGFTSTNATLFFTYTNW